MPRERVEWGGYCYPLNRLVLLQCGLVWLIRQTERTSIVQQTRWMNGSSFLKKKKKGGGENREVFPHVTQQFTEKQNTVLTYYVMCTQLFLKLEQMSTDRFLKTWRWYNSWVLMHRILLPRLTKDKFCTTPQPHTWHHNMMLPWKQTHASLW